jgi:Leucine-rich repeat (LRR) protein
MHWQFYRSFRFVLIAVALLSAGRGYAQDLLDSMQLDQTYTFMELEEAVRFPDKVIKLELRKKKLKEFPKEIFQFKNLQWLDLGRNSLTELPDSIYKLENLQYLNVSRNKLSSLPKENGKMTNLVYLNANNNDLIGLPPQIGNLEKLRVLDLWSNDLSDFPESLSKLEELRVLDVRAITISQETITQLKKWLPRTNVHYDLPCNCKL